MYDLDTPLGLLNDGTFPRIQRNWKAEQEAYNKLTEEELTKLLTEEIRRQIDKEILEELFKNARNNNYTSDRH